MGFCDHRLIAALAVSLLGAFGCDRGKTPFTVDAIARDAAQHGDGASGPNAAQESDIWPQPDLHPPRDVALFSDTVPHRDQRGTDTSFKPDSWLKPDSGIPHDAALKHDAALARDLQAHAPDQTTTPGPPCLTGSGTAAYRVSYGPYGTSAHVDAWGLKSNDWWEVVPVNAAGQLVDSNQSLQLGGTSAYVRIRWSFTGIASYKSAQLCIYARSYSTGTSSKFRVWSPIHGETTSPLISVYPYSWTCVDYTQLMSIADQPGLLGFRLYPDQYGASSLAVNKIELCLQGVAYQ